MRSLGVLLYAFYQEGKNTTSSKNNERVLCLYIRQFILSHLVIIDLLGHEYVILNTNT